MSTFAEMLPTATAEMREFVEAYDRDLGAWLAVTTTSRPHPLEQMRAEPPAKEPESVEGICAGYGLPSANRMLDVVRVLVDVAQDEALNANIQRGDKLTVIKEYQNNGQH